MLTLRASADRGHSRLDWLDSRFSFSFADYYDPRHMGFRVLRVINQDVIAPRTGFGMHGHRDMEIISWVLDGELEHRDSLGNGGILRPGDAQVMTAGRGIRHSEMNPSPDRPGHLLQIWITTRAPGLEPAYDQRHFPVAERQGVLCPVASGDGRGRSLVIQQDATVYTALLARGSGLDHRPGSGRHAWIQVATGTMTVNGSLLSAGDGLAVSAEPVLHLAAQADSQFLLIDLP